MSLFPSNVFNYNPSQQPSNQLNNTVSTFGTTLSQTTFTQSQPANLSLPQNTGSAFGRRGGRGVARGMGLDGLGTRGVRGGRGGFRGGRGGFGSLGNSVPQMFSDRVQSISSIFGSTGGPQRLPDDGGRSFGGFGSDRPNPNQPLITQNLSRPRNHGWLHSREEVTLLGLENATRRTGQRSLFDRPNASALSTTTNQMGNGGGLINNANPLTLSTTTNLTGNGGLFNNRPAGHYAVGLVPRLSNTSIFTNSIPRTHYSSLAPYHGGPTLPSRGPLYTGNSTFTAGRQTIQDLNRNLAQPTRTPQMNGFSHGLFSSGQSSSVQTLNNRLNPPLVNPSNTSSTLQPYNFSKNLTGTQTATFSTNQLQTQATTFSSSIAPVQQQNITENNPSQPQNESASEEEDEEYCEEEEVSEGTTTFAEDLQDLMANHQIAAPVNLFSDDTFTQNLVQFLKGFQIKAPRNKVLFRPQEEESKTEVNNQEEPFEKAKEPIQNRGISNEEKEVNETLPPNQSRCFRSVTNESLFGSNGFNYDPQSQSTQSTTSNPIDPNIFQQNLNQLAAIRNERVQILENLRRGTESNGPEPQILHGLTQASTAEEIRSVSQQMLLAFQDSVRNASDAHQRSLLNSRNGGSLFNNQPPMYNSFGLVPPASNASIFANSTPNTYSVGLAPYNGVPAALPSREYLSGGNSFITSGQTLENLNSSLAQPTATTSSVFGQGFSFGTPQITPTPSFSASNNSVQLLNNRLNPPLVNSSSTLQPSIVNNNSAFSPNKPQIQAITAPSVNFSDSTTPVQQQHITEENPPQPQNESVGEGEEEEVSEGATTFAEDLQDLMANHQLAAPENLFSDDTFTQNLVQFLKGFHIKAPRNKILFRPQEEESEAEVNNQEESVEKEEEPVQNREILNEGKGKEVSEKVPSSRGKGFRSVKSKIKRGMYKGCQIQGGSIRFDS